jgi:hypothetical protein
VPVVGSQCFGMGALWSYGLTGGPEALTLCGSPVKSGCT